MSDRILLVDDDPAIVESMRMVLEEQGFQVFTATDGAAGWELIRSELPALVVLDIMMPRSTGFVVLEKLAAEPVPGLKVVIITAASTEKSRAYAQFQGAAAYLPKPFSMDALLACVRQQLAGA